MTENKQPTTQGAGSGSGDQQYGEGFQYMDARQDPNHADYDPSWTPTGSGSDSQSQSSSKSGSDTSQQGSGSEQGKESGQQ